MALAPIHNGVIGYFVEKSFCNVFEFCENPEMTLAPLAHGGKNMRYPHRIWVTTPVAGIDSGWRYAKVGKTVAHVITNEDENGFVVEKWDIKKVRMY